MVLQAINILLCFIIIGFVTGAITWIVAIFDAYKSAERINQAQEG